MWNLLKFVNIVSLDNFFLFPNHKYLKIKRNKKDGEIKEMNVCEFNLINLNFYQKVF